MDLSRLWQKARGQQDGIPMKSQGNVKLQWFQPERFVIKDATVDAEEKQRDGNSHRTEHDRTAE